MSAPAPHGWRTRLKRVPGVAGLARRLFSPSFEGAWLYRQEVVGWLYDARLRRQLPWPLRPFAAWAAVQRPLWDDVVGGQPVLRAGMAVAERLGMADHARIEVGPYTAFVSLRDPRLLQVPNELTDASDTRVLARLLGPGDSFVDVGANHGAFSIVASHLVGRGGAVVAVEPQPHLAALVRRSLAANAPETRTAVHALALSDRDGALDLHVPRGSSGSATLLDGVATDAAWDTIRVPVARLDDAVAWRDLPGRVVVKLDVEGGEAAVLRGARSFVEARRPALLIEVNPSRIASAEGAGSLVALVRDLGYDAFAELDAPGDARPLGGVDLGHQRNVVLYHRDRPAPA